MPLAGNQHAVTGLREIEGAFDRFPPLRDHDIAVGGARRETGRNLAEDFPRIFRAGIVAG